MLFFYIRLRCLLGGIKQPKSNWGIINFYFSKPFVVFFANTYKATFVVFSQIKSIVRVLHIGCFSQVNQTITKSIPIYMVNLIGRPNSVNIKPRKPMRQIKHIVQPNYSVPCFGDTPDLASNLASSARNFPSKNSSRNIVVSQKTQSLNSYHFNFPFIKLGKVNINTVLLT